MQVLQAQAPILWKCTMTQPPVIVRPMHGGWWVPLQVKWLRERVKWIEVVQFHLHASHRCFRRLIAQVVLLALHVAKTELVPGQHTLVKLCGNHSAGERNVWAGRLSSGVAPAGFVQEHHRTLDIKVLLKEPGIPCWDIRQTTLVVGCGKPAPARGLVSPARCTSYYQLLWLPHVLAMRGWDLPFLEEVSHKMLRFWIISTRPSKDRKSKLCKRAGLRCSVHGCAMVGSATQYSCGFMRYLLRINVVFLRFVSHELLRASDRRFHAWGQSGGIIVVQLFQELLLTIWTPI